MRLLVRACGAVVSVAMAVFAGCGGNVILDNGTGGSGGSGGGSGGATSTTTPTTTTTSISTTSITTTTTSVSTTSITTTTTATGPSTCDNSGNCGDIQSGCVGCAVAGNCAQAYTDCTDTSECIDYVNCVSNCPNPDAMCQQACQMQYPMGESLYTALVVCVICVECPNDCQAANSGCPN